MNNMYVDRQSNNIFCSYAYKYLQIYIYLINLHIFLHAMTEMKYTEVNAQKAVLFYSSVYW